MKFNVTDDQFLRRLKTCHSSSDFLLALAELEETVVARDLCNAGFDADHAKKLLLYSSSKQEWQFSRKEHDLYSRHIWPKASSIAANLGNSEICLGHILLVLLHKHRTHAYKVMTKLGVNQDRLLDVLTERMRLKAKDETT